MPGLHGDRAGEAAGIRQGPERCTGLVERGKSRIIRQRAQIERAVRAAADIQRVAASADNSAYEAVTVEDSQAIGAAGELNGGGLRDAVAAQTAGN